MGITLATKLTIQNRDDLIVSHAGPGADGKYSGWITLGPDDYCRPLISTAAIFETADLAEQHMRDVMAELKAA